MKIIGVFRFGFRSLERCAEANAVPKTCILSLDQQEPPKLVPKTLEMTVCNNLSVCVFTNTYICIYYYLYVTSNISYMFEMAVFPAQLTRKSFTYSFQLSLDLTYQNLNCGYVNIMELMFYFIIMDFIKII